MTGPVSITTASSSRIEEPPEAPEPAPEAPRPRLLKRRLRSESREPSAAPVPPPPAPKPTTPVVEPESEELVKEEIVELPRPRVSLYFLPSLPGGSKRIIVLASSYSSDALRQALLLKFWGWMIPVHLSTQSLFLRGHRNRLLH